MPYLSTAARKRFMETSSLISKLVIIALFFTLAGTYYAHLRNEQVCIKRELNALNCELSISQMNTKQMEAKTESLANRWSILDRLNQNHSQLSSIQAGQIEVVTPHSKGTLAHNSHSHE